MRHPDVIDLGIIGLAGAGAFVTVNPDENGYAATVVFATSLLTLLGLAVRQVVVSGRGAHAEARRARELGRVDPTTAAGQAVEQERLRLSGELVSCIREALEAVRHELASGREGADMGEKARRIHSLASEATSELRRLLGLLRAGPGVAPGVEAAALSRSHLTWHTVLAALAVALLAAGESLAHYGTGASPPSAFVLPWTPLLTAVAAFTVAGWRVAPSAAAFALAATFVVPPVAAGIMVGSGAWMVITISCLTWALASRGLHNKTGVLAVATMAGAGFGSRMHDDPPNAGILLVLVAVTWSIGYVVGWNRRRQASATQRVVARQTHLDRVRTTALRAERLGLARELHDIVSHAVGVIAVQAAAAQVSWPRDPRTSLRALEVIDRAASDALAELGRLVPEGSAQPPHDLRALVERIRATGTTVRLAQQGVTAGRVDAVMYRVLQEGLTNAVRHAPGAAVSLLIDTSGDAYLVRVADDGPGPGTDFTRGFGLTGLGERVALQGGTLRTGRGLDGRGFLIEAILPRQREKVG